MYGPPCPHGYVNGSCAQCRAAARNDDAGPELLTRYDAEHRGKPRAELLGRRAECIARAAELKGYGRLSQAQAREADDLIAETIIIDDLIKDSDVEIRRSAVERGRSVMADPANAEGPDGGSHAAGNGAYGGAPPLVSGLGDRREIASQTLQRARSNPWRSADGPVNRADTAAGLISRAHAALETLEPQLTHDGCEKLALALAESGGRPGMTVKRSRDDQAEAAELFLALSDPFYAQALRSVLRYPADFMAGGTGYLSWSD